jgi:hypothetical protein
MWFQLDYPKTHKYAIPYMTECFYAGSAILIVILIALNSKSVLGWPAGSDGGCSCGVWERCCDRAQEEPEQHRFQVVGSQLAA